MGLFYISGTHSCGKSLLLESLRDEINIVIIPRKPREELFTQEEFKLLVNGKNRKVPVFNNLMKRLKISIDETREQMEFAIRNDSNCVFADQFLLDCRAYIKTCYKLQWLSFEDYKLLDQRFISSFDILSNYNYHGFFLKPSFKNVKEKFLSSCLDGSRYWEKKSNYLKTSYDIFSELYEVFVEENPENWCMITEDLGDRQKLSLIKAIK